MVIIKTLILDSLGFLTRAANIKRHKKPCVFGAECRNLYEHKGKEEVDREASPTCFSNCST